MPKDLRSYLASMKGSPPDFYLEIDKPLSPEYELSAVLLRLEQQKKFPTVLFKNVSNLLGETGHSVVMNLTALRENLAFACGLDRSQYRMELTNKLSALYDRPCKPVKVPQSEAPVKSRIFIEDADLRKLPVVTTHEADGGPYLTMMAATRHPEWDPVAPGVYNVAFHRMQYKGPRKGGIFIGYTHNNAIFQMYEKKDVPCPIAIVLGHHPLFLLGAMARPPFDASEYDIIGGFLGEPLRLTPSETWGDDFLVPADAEIVIEAEILPHIREPEGPFGEWTGHTSGRTVNPVFEVRAITMRDPAILASNFVGHRDYDGLCGPAWELSMFKRVKEAVAGVRGVYLPPSGRSGFHAYVQIEKFAEGDQTIAALAAATLGQPKLILVVDEDVDIFDEDEVWMAVSCRIQADQDVQIIRNLKGSPLDPSNRGRYHHATLIIDATKPFGQPFVERVRVPEEVVKRIRLEEIFRRDIDE
jgi:2,5-furandicarboxylate decarboxylase 1